MRGRWLVFALSLSLAACRGGSGRVEATAAEGPGAEGAPASREEAQDAAGSVLLASGVEVVKEVAPGRTWILRALTCRAAGGTEGGVTGLGAGALELEEPRVTALEDGNRVATLTAGSGRYEEGVVECAGGAELEGEGWRVSAPRLRWWGAENRVEAAGPTTLSYGGSELEGDGCTARLSPGGEGLASLHLGTGRGRLLLADLDRFLEGK